MRKGFKPEFTIANRRTLQRDLKEMLTSGILATEGETHNLLYRIR